MSAECLFWAVKAKIGNPQRKLILIALADIANEKRQCWPSHAYISTIAECSKSSVIRHLAFLQDEGLINIENRKDGEGKKSNLYTIYPMCHPDTTLVSQRHHPSVTVTHNTLIDTHIDTIRNMGLSETWEEWIKHRKEIKKPLTPDSIKRQVNFLEKSKPEDRIGIIEQSIRNGYTGLFHLKGNKHGNNQSSNSNYRPGTAAAAAAKLRARIKSSS